MWLLKILLEKLKNNDSIKNVRGWLLMKKFSRMSKQVNIYYFYLNIYKYVK